MMGGQGRRDVLMVASAQHPRQPVSGREDLGAMAPATTPSTSAHAAKGSHEPREGGGGGCCALHDRTDSSVVISTWGLSATEGEHIDTAGVGSPAQPA